jgi:hypothetical protein
MEYACAVLAGNSQGKRPLRKIRYRWEVSAKLSLSLIKHYALKTYGGVEI